MLFCIESKINWQQHLWTAHDCPYVDGYSSFSDYLLKVSKQYLFGNKPQKLLIGKQNLLQNIETENDTIHIRNKLY